MPDFAIIYVSQVLGNSGEKHIRDSVFSESDNIRERHFSSGADSFSVHHLCAVQNPKPIYGKEGLATVDNNDWSDGPILDPTRPENKRFAYGRGPTRTTPGTYGRLSQYSGVVINQKNFAAGEDYTINDTIVDNYSNIRHLTRNKQEEVQVQNKAQVEGETTISQYDFLLYADPEPFSYKNPVDTNIAIRLGNYIHTLNSGSLTLEVNGESKDIDSIIPFYSGLGGFDATWINDRNFGYNEQVDVEWRVFDTSTPANEIVFKYWFRTVQDWTGPRISNLSPADDETNVTVSGCISFDLRDYEKGVNINSLELYVNNKLIDNSDLTISMLSSLDGYSVRYCQVEPFLYGDEIPVSVYVEDSSEEKNYLFHVYSFITETSSAPRAVSRDPAPCRKNIQTDKDVNVDIVDGGHGLNPDTIKFDVDDTETKPRKAPIIYREE